MNRLTSIVKAAIIFLKGWEVFIVAAVFTWKAMCHDCASAGFAVSILNSMGWNQPGTVLPFDPVSAAMALGVTYALGQHLVVAWKQYKAGVPLQYVQTEKGAVLKTVNTASVRDVVAELKKEPVVES